MNDNKNKVNELIVNDAFKPAITPNEIKKAMPILKSFVKSYYDNKDTMEINDWLNMEFKNHLPEENVENIQNMSNEIIESVALQEEKHESLKSDISKGRTKESWLNSEIQKATVNMSAIETQKYYQEIDSAIFEANKNMANVALTKEGLINQNPSLDGFIAEQHHVETFNINAKASGSKYHAEVVPPSDTGFDKDSVDIVIKDKNGNVVKEYQSKFYKDAKSTEKAFEQGDYTGQEKLVPKGQASDMQVKASEIIEAPDGTKSTSISKSDAKNMQEAAQDKNGDGKPTEYSYDNVSNKDLVKQTVGQISLGVAIGGIAGAGSEFIRQACNDEEFDKDKIIQKGKAGAIDSGVKVALCGGITVCAKKGIIKALGKNPAVAVVSGIVQIGVENVKIAHKIFKKELTVKEGINEMEIVSTGIIGSTVGATAGATKGATIGGTIGSVFGPVGIAVGGVVGGIAGGIIGGIAGGKVGETCAKANQKIRDYVEKCPPIILNVTPTKVKNPPIQQTNKNKVLAIAGNGGGSSSSSSSVGSSSSSSGGGGIISSVCSAVSSVCSAIGSFFGF